MNDREDVWRRFAADYRGVPVSPEAKQRLLDRIAATPLPQRGWVLALRWNPGEPRLSPVVAGAAVVGAFLLGAAFTRLALSPRLDHAKTAATAGASTSPLVPVRFNLIAHGARSVSLVGDFNRWDKANLTMTRVSSDGLWTVTVRLPRGSHSYSFVVDGHRWVSDPAAPLGPDDGFGSRSSVVVVRDLKAT